MSKPKIFMSYSHADWDWCRPFALGLRDKGCDVWFDERLGSGEPWVPRLEQQVQLCEFFVLVLTPEAWASEWVQREFQLALITHRRILPLKLKETTTGGFLLTLQWISVEDCTPEVAGDKVLQAVGQTEPETLLDLGDAAPTLTEPRPALPEDVTSAAIHDSVAEVVQPKLFVWSINGTAPPQVVTLPRHQLTIGREFDNGLVLGDLAVSRHHALITQEKTPGQPPLWTLRAQPGSGPIYVNGHVSTELVLRPFDQIVLGTTLLRFELSGAQQRQTLTETAIRWPLLIVDCPLCHFVAPLRDPLVLLGRAPGCGLIIPSPIVARKQAQLQRQAQGGYSITDSGGSNAVLWQGTPVQPLRQLHHGDILTIDAQIPALTVVMRYSISPL